MDHAGGECAPIQWQDSVQTQASIPRAPVSGSHLAPSQVGYQTGSEGPILHYSAGGGNAVDAVNLIPPGSGGRQHAHYYNRMGDLQPQPQQQGQPYPAARFDNNAQGLWEHPQPFTPAGRPNGNNGVPRGLESGTVYFGGGDRRSLPPDASRQGRRMQADDTSLQAMLLGQQDSEVPDLCDGDSENEFPHYRSTQKMQELEEELLAESDDEAPAGSMRGRPG